MNFDRRIFAFSITVILLLSGCSQAELESLPRPDKPTSSSGVSSQESATGRDTSSFEHSVEYRPVIEQDGRVFYADGSRNFHLFQYIKASEEAQEIVPETVHNFYLAAQSLFFSTPEGLFRQSVSGETPIQVLNRPSLIDLVKNSYNNFVQSGNNLLFSYRDKETDRDIYYQYNLQTELLTETVSFVSPSSSFQTLWNNYGLFHSDGANLYFCSENTIEFRTLNKLSREIYRVSSPDERIIAAQYAAGSFYVALSNSADKSLSIQQLNLLGKPHAKSVSVPYEGSKGACFVESQFYYMDLYQNLWSVDMLSKKEEPVAALPTILFHVEKGIKSAGVTTIGKLFGNGDTLYFYHQSFYDTRQFSLQEIDLATGKVKTITHTPQ